MTMNGTDICPVCGRPMYEHSGSACPTWAVAIQQNMLENVSATLKKIEKLQAENERLRAELARVTKERDELDSRYDELFEKSISHLATLTNENTWLRAKSETADDRESALIEKFASFRTDLQESMKQCDEYALQIVNAERAASFWHKKCLEARRMAAELELSSQMARDELDESFIISDKAGDCVYFRWCQICGGNMQILSPGVALCTRCGQ